MPAKPPKPPEPSTFERLESAKKEPLKLDGVAPDVGMDTHSDERLGLFSVASLQRHTSGAHRLPRRDGLAPPPRDLKPGDRGEAVELLQRCLVALGHLPAAEAQGEAARFGPRTAAAVRAFQAAHRLHPSGTYTAFTRGALQQALDAQEEPPGGAG